MADIVRDGDFSPMIPQRVNVVWFIERRHHFPVQMNSKPNPISGAFLLSDQVLPPGCDNSRRKKG
jgi:hypothetical protein